MQTTLGTKRRELAGPARKNDDNGERSTVSRRARARRRHETSAIRIRRVSTTANLSPMMDAEASVLFRNRGDKRRGLSRQHDLADYLDKCIAMVILALEQKKHNRAGRRRCGIFWYRRTLEIYDLD